MGVLDGLRSAVRATPDVSSIPSARDDVERVGSLAHVLMDTIDVAVVACDADGRLTFFNPAARRFHGLEADPTVDSRDWARRFDLYAADGTRLLAPEEIPLTRALVDGSVRDAVITISPVGSVPRVVRCDGQQLRGPDDAVLGAVVTMTDITEARRDKLALEQERDRARSIVRAAGDAYVEVDDDLHITAWNPAAEQLFGWPESTAVGEDILSLLAPASRRAAYRKNIYDFLLAAKDVDQGSSLDVSVRTRDGSELRVCITAWPASGDGWGFQAFVRPC